MNNYEKDKPEKSLPILEILFLYICVVSLVNVLLLALGYFYPVYSLIGSFVLLTVGLLLIKVKVSFIDKRFSLWFVGIFLIAVCLRLSPNLYLTGGQDQGTYVSLSKQYEVNHSLYITDELRESLSDDAKYLYDIGNNFLGVKKYNIDKSEYYMPFYPVFPSWMSVFSSLFGSDNRVYALTMFGVLSVVGMYLFAYEISGRNRRVALLAAFFLAVNPLHVYFSRIPLTEVVYLTFLLFAFYFLLRFYNEYRSGRVNQIYLGASLVVSAAMFLTRMNGVFFVPVIILIPLLAYLFGKDRLLLKYLVVYSTTWIALLLLSFMYYKQFIPYLFNLVLGKRLLNFLSTGYVPYILGFVVLGFVLIMVFKKSREIFGKWMKFLGKALPFVAIFLFVGLIGYELYFYIKEIFIDNSYSLFSFDSLSYLKQLSFLATFLYLSPVGFVILPISIWYFRKEKNISISLLVLYICIFLVYCWGVLRLTQYHYYFVRYQLSELIPFCTVFISMFLIDVSKSKLGKIVLWFTVVFLTLYFGYFSILQLRDYEGADKSKYEEIQSIVTDRDLVLVAKNEFTSFGQVTFPMKYYFKINVFPLYRLTYMEEDSILELKNRYEDLYILSALPDLEGKRIKLVDEIDFEHNYFTHCNRDEDSYFKMSGHSSDILLCEYIIIPNRYYYGTYTVYLYLWE